MTPRLAAAMALVIVFCVHLKAMNYMVTSKFPAVNALGFATMLLMLYYKKLYVSVKNGLRNNSDFCKLKNEFMKLFSLISKFISKVKNESFTSSAIIDLLHKEVLDYYESINKAMWDKHAEDIAMSRKNNTICCSKPSGGLARAINQFGNISHYRHTYSNNLFVPWDILIDFCMKNGLICIPIKLLGFKLRANCKSDIESFRPEDEDIWYSNFPDNILEFGTDECIKTNLSALVEKEHGKVPGLTVGKLTKMPYYVLLKTVTEVSDISMTTMRGTGEGVILHPTPHGFIVVTHWE